MDDSYNWWSIVWRAVVVAGICAIWGLIWPSLYEPMFNVALNIPWIVIVFAVGMAVVVHYTT